MRCNSTWLQATSRLSDKINASIRLTALASCLIACEPNRVSAASTEKSDPVRTFLQSPPAFCSFAVEKTIHVQPGKQKIAPTVVLGRWHGDETNWFQSVPSRATSPTNAEMAEKSQSFSGRVGNLYWSCENNDLTLYHQEWNTNAEGHATALFARYANFAAQTVLRLGLPDVDFQNAVWSENSFQSTGGWDLWGNKPAHAIIGTIRRRSPEEWEISVTNVQTRVLEQQAIVQGEQQIGGRFHPRQIERFQLIRDRKPFGQKGWLKILTMRVLEYRVDPTEPSDLIFDPTRMPQLQRKSLNFYTNDLLYTLGASGQSIQPGKSIDFADAVRVRVLRRVQPAKHPKRGFLSIFAVVAFLIAVSTLAFLFRNRQSKLHDTKPA